MSTCKPMPMCVAGLAIFVLPVAALAAESAAVPETTAWMSPVTVYGGDYRVLPGAASLNILTTELPQGGDLATTRDLTALAPNFTVLDGNNNRMPRFSVRGLRENNFTTGDPVVGLYLDDVPCADLYSRSLLLHEVESIEFIRGPQGTLYGASGPAGVLNITSRQPGEVWQGRAGFTCGNYDLQAYDATVSGPVVSNLLALGVSGIYSARDGFVKNVGDGHRLDDQETLAGRVQLRWTPVERLEFSLIGSGQSFNDDFVPTYIPTEEPFRVSRDYPGYVDTDTWNTALKAAWRGEAAKVTSVTSYRSWQQDLAQDFDFSANPMGATVGFSEPDLSQWTEEVRIRSLEADAAWKWNAGLYFASSELDTTSGSITENLPLPAPYPPGLGINSTTHADSEATTYAVFGEATYTVREKLDVIGGLRLTWDERAVRRSRSGVALDFTAFPPTVPFGGDDYAYQTSENYSALQPKLGLAYHFQPECMMFATVSSGYQSGGFNVSNDTEAESGFDPAESWHFETGLRTLWLDRRLEFNAALFYILTEDYQVYRLSETDPTQAWLLNADRAYSWGAEAEIVARATEALSFSLLGGWTHAEFDEFTDEANSRDFDGNTINFVPEFTVTIAAEYRIWKGLYARAEVVGVGEFYLDEANTEKQSAYALLNGRIGYAQDHFEVFIFGRNLLDQEYVSNALDFRSAATPNLLVRQPGDPLVFGAAISARF